MPNQDTLSVELIVEDGAADVVLKRNEQKLRKFGETTEKIKPQINYSGVTRSLDELEKKADATRKTFEGVVKTRLGGDNFNGFTKDLVRAQEQARILSSTIRQTRTALTKTTDKTLIKVYLEDLKAAEKELAELERKQSALFLGQSRAGATGGSLPSSGARGRTRGGFSGLFSESPGMARFQKQQIFYQANDVATMAAMGANPMQIIASQSGQIAQIFEPSRVAAVASAYAGLVTVAVAGAAAIALTYKITGDIRSEAERRLKVEEMIAGAINRQILSQKKALDDLAEARRNAQFDREFQRGLQSNPVEQLKEQRASIEQLIKLTPATLPVIEDGKVVSKANQSYQRLAEQLQALDAQIVQTGLNRQKTASDAFTERWESWKRSQNDALETEEKTAEEFKRNVDKGREKIKELERTHLDVFSNLAQKTGSSNPFVQVFSEAEKSIGSVREQTKGLSADLQNAALALQQSINSRALFESRLNNDLDVFDLREQAANFRNPRESDEERQKRLDDMINDYLRADRRFGIGGENAGNLLMRVWGAKNTNDLNASQRQDLFEYAALFNVKAQGMRPENFVGYLAGERRRMTESGENLSVQERLEKQLGIIKSRVTNDEERGVAERKFIALTSGMDPSKLNSRLSEQAAIFRENEATRKENSEKDAIKRHAENIKLQTEIRDETKKLRELVQSKGLAGVIEIVDKSNGAARVLQAAAPKPEDTADYYNGNLNFGSGGSFSNR